MTHPQLRRARYLQVRIQEQEHELDVIIFATGFLLKENYSIFMDYNKEIREFADSPDYGTYYGTFHGLAPNFCTFLGPMTGLGHNSIIFMIGRI